MHSLAAGRGNGGDHRPLIGLGGVSLSRQVVAGAAGAGAGEIAGGLAGWVAGLDIEPRQDPEELQPVVEVLAGQEGEAIGCFRRIGQR